MALSFCSGLKSLIHSMLQKWSGFYKKISFFFCYSDSVFESLETGYLEKCAINLKAPMAGTDCPTQVSHTFSHTKDFARTT